MLRYSIRETDPSENGAYQYGVFEYDTPKDKPHIQLTRPKLIATFSYEWRAEKFIKEKYKEQTMSRDKQIKEMAELIYKETDLYNVDTAYDISTVLHDEGYRKSSEVAREIFEEIDRMCIDTFGNFNHRVFAELKKKYTESEKDK